MQSLPPSVQNNRATHELDRTSPQKQGTEYKAHTSTMINSLHAIDPCSHHATSQETQGIIKDTSRSGPLAAISQKRVNKGRFSKAATGSSVSSSGRLEEQKEKCSSRVSSKSPVLLKRESPGQFGSSFVVADDSLLNHNEPPRGRSRERSKTSSKSLEASSQVRDVQTAGTDRSSIEGVSKSRSRSRSRNATLQERDSKGRFRSASMAMDVTLKTQTPTKKPLDLNIPINAVSQETGCTAQFSVGENARQWPPKDESHSPCVPMVTGTVTIQETDKSGRPEKTMAKKPSSKSPYFPVAPSQLTTNLPANPELEGTATTPNKSVPSKPPRTPKSSDGEGTPKKVRTPSTPGGTVSCIPFPPLSAPYFGLIQEKLAHDPFRLLIAVTFLIRTHGKDAIPVFYELMERFPTPESLATARKDDIIPLIRHLGLQNQRAGTYQTYAQIWIDNPPVKGKRYPVRDYPTKGAGRDIKKDEILTNDDERIAWEIGHMTRGPYAIDSWRIFCRDELRGVAKGWNGEAAKEGFQPEWMRVLPEDKELRAYLRWMWLKEGFEWDPSTGDKEVASGRLIRAAIEGNIVWDDRGGMRILDDMNDALVDDKRQNSMADVDGGFVP